jgi:hypothetical protein
MALWLREDTATTIVVGPLVDSVDATKEEGLTITSSEVLVWKEGGTSFNAKNEASAATHRSYGMYTVPLDATDTNTPGQLIVGVFEAGIMVARSDFMVVAQNTYDSLVLGPGTDYLQVDSKQVASNTNAATQLANIAGTMQAGTVFDDGVTYINSTTVIYCDDITEATPDHYIGKIITFRSGNLQYQSTEITDYEFVAATYAKFTVVAMTEAASDGNTFEIS